MPRKIVYNDTSSSSYLNEVKSAHLYLSPPNTNTKKKITVFRDVILCLYDDSSTWESL